MADKTNTYNMIAALRRETAKNAVSPELLGSILKSIVDLIDGTVDNANLDTGSGNSSHSNTFGALVEDDTYTPIVVSDIDVQIEPGATRTLTMNRTAEEVLLSAYDEGLVNVIVADGTITVVALQDGSTEFSISDEGSSVTVRVRVGEVVAPAPPMSEIERLISLKQDIVVGVRETDVNGDIWSHGVGLMLERPDYTSPLVTYVAGPDASEISGAFYAEKGKVIRVYCNSELDNLPTDVAIIRIYDDEPDAGTLAAPVATLPYSEMGSATMLEFEAGISGYYALSGINKIYSVTIEEDVTVADVLAMKQDKETGKGLSANDYTNADKQKLYDLPTAANLTAELKKIPNDISRSQNDATFVHSENGVITNLFYLRQANSSMAGLMTKDMFVKLNGLPSSVYSQTQVDNLLQDITAVIPGSYTYNATELILTPPDDNTPLITLPAATTSSAGVMSAADKTLLDSIPGVLDDKQDKVPLSTSSGLTDNLKLNPGNNQVTNHYAVALGFSLVVSGQSAAALCSKNQASGDASFSAGYKNKSTGAVSVTLGESLLAGNRAEIAVGKFNATTTGQIFAVGCGTSENDRRNAIVVDANGSVLFPEEQTSVASILQQIQSLINRVSALEGTT